MLKKVQMRGGARRPHARRTLCTLSVRARAPTKQMGLFQQPASTTVLRNISPVPANAHTIDKAVVGAGCGPGVHTRWRSTRERGVQAAPGAPRGLKFLGIRAGRRKARGAGGESLARSAARKAYAAIHNAPW